MVAQANSLDVDLSVCLIYGRLAAQKFSNRFFFLNDGHLIAR